MRTLFILAIAMLTGCSVVERAGMKVLYRPAPVGETKVIHEIPYVPGSDIAKHRLDLFHPPGKNWPLWIFVHGGSWTSGDKSLTAAGQDIYGNIGRYFAARGIGVAIINYRLLPDTTWRGQIDDVAGAVGWAGKNIARHGGDPSKIYIGGHSAGAHLASYIALNQELAAKHHLPKLAGAICLSGAAYDMTDRETYRLGNAPSFYALRFAENGNNPDWQVNASSATYARKNAPPVLLFVAEGDSAPLRRQSTHFSEILSEKGIANHLIIVPGESHIRIILALTRPEKIIAPAIESFIKSNGKIPAAQQ
jgi:acetyl esterase/lipase